MRPKGSISNDNGSDVTSESSVRKIRPMRRGSLTVSGAKASSPVAFRHQTSSSNSGNNNNVTNKNGKSNKHRKQMLESWTNRKQRKSESPKKKVSMEIVTNEKKNRTSQSHDPPSPLAANKTSKFKQSFKNLKLLSTFNQETPIIGLKSSKSSGLSSHSAINVSSTQSSSHHSCYVPLSKASRQTNPKSNDVSSPAKSSAMPASEQTSALFSKLQIHNNRFVKSKKGSNQSSTESSYSPSTTSPSTSTTSKRKVKPKKLPSTGKRINIQVNTLSTAFGSVISSGSSKTKYSTLKQPTSSQSPGITSKCNLKAVISTPSLVTTAISRSPQQRSVEISTIRRRKQSPRNGREKLLSSQMTPPTMEPSATQDDETVGSSINTSKFIYEISEFSIQTNYFAVKKMCNFVNRCACIQLNSLLKEYEEVCKILPSETLCCVGLAPCNRQRNRYNDILCIDATRVILRFPDDVVDDYIHANTVQGRHLRNRFILTQGPLSRTVPDFWRLIWQEKVPLIFMLCNNLEDNKRKCADYLPSINSDGMTVCGVRIIIVAQNHHFHQTLIETKLLLTHANKEHCVSHWKWIGWPDYKVPKQNLLIPFQLLKMSRAAKGSTLVHCSAGVGRSGSLVVLELCLMDLINGEELKVQECVEFVRRQRAHSVQSAVQYLFIHRALLEFAVSSNLTPPKTIERFIAKYENFINQAK